jgi:hypothetical protein
MAELFYREDRDVDFLNVCEQVRSEGKGLSTSDIVSKAILRPAKSFYLHRREYSTIIRKNGNRLPNNHIKRRMHLDILERYQNLKKNNPNMDASEGSKIIAEQSAPRFYISERRAEDIYYQSFKKTQP